MPTLPIQRRWSRCRFTARSAYPYPAALEHFPAGILAKSVLDAGWFGFIAKLRYKAASAGRQLIEVDPRGTS